MWKKYTGEHDIHDGSMIRNENVLFIPIFFLLRKLDEIISEAHSIKHSKTPDADKFIRIFIMLFIKR